MMARKIKRLHKKTQAKNDKFVSIIVPAYNEEKSIAKCVESMLKQNYGGRKEVIVISDGSTDRTSVIASQYPIKFVNLAKNGGKANALNEATKYADGDIIIFSDGDSNMAQDAVSSLVHCFETNPSADIVTGTVLINDQSNGKLLTRCQMIEYHLEQEITRHLQGLNGRVIVCPGPITAVKRDVCDKIKYSDETIVEDADFTVCALKEDMKIVRDPYAKVYTNAPTTIKGWYKQRRRWWYGNLQVWRNHKPWSITNPWMIYNYANYVISAFSVIMLLSMPYLLSQYDNPFVAVLHGLIYTAIPVSIYIMFNMAFFMDNKKLIPILIPYMLLYNTIKMFVLAQLYICYITKLGMNVQFGSRKFRAK